jgi:hypothetical protein
MVEVTIVTSLPQTVSVRAFLWDWKRCFMAPLLLSVQASPAQYLRPRYSHTGQA